MIQKASARRSLGPGALGPTLSVSGRLSVPPIQSRRPPAPIPIRMPPIWLRARSSPQLRSVPPVCAASSNPHATPAPQAPSSDLHATHPVLRAPSSDPRATHPASHVAFFQERTPNLTVWGKKLLIKVLCKTISGNFTRIKDFFDSYCFLETGYNRS